MMAYFDGLVEVEGPGASRRSRPSTQARIKRLILEQDAPSVLSARHTSPAREGVDVVYFENRDPAAVGQLEVRSSVKVRFDARLFEGDGRRP